tara:strand:+ start:149 stop:490 length:342 start_codon:yes stop_codon:yes gene_type:complete
MIYNIKANHTGTTENTLLGHTKQSNNRTYRVHSCKITNTDSTNVYIHVRIHDGTESIDVVRTFYIRKGYTVELFDKPFDYPDKYDLMIALDNLNYQVSWITQTEVLDDHSHIE